MTSKTRDPLVSRWRVAAQALVDDLAAARAESDRLHGVVEAVQALADSWDADGVAAKASAEARRGLSDERDLRIHAGKMRLRAAELRAVLAPVSSSGEDNPEHDPGTRPNHRPGSFLDKRDRRGVGVSRPADPITATTGATPLGNISSSGEAESGEADLARAQAKFDSLRAELDVRKARDAVTPHCPTCGSDGEPLQSSKDDSFCPDGFHTSAPVPSGGQADGEGARLTDAEWREFQRLPEEGYSHRGWVDAAIARRLAARPVLSREALRERLDGHWPIRDEHGVGCGCGWEGDGCGRGLWRDHLVDVLTAGGEQACSSCGGSMDSPGCCTSPETKVSHPQGFHTVSGGRAAGSSQDGGQ